MIDLLLLLGLCNILLNFPNFLELASTALLWCSDLHRGCLVNELRMCGIYTFLNKQENGVTGTIATR